jgi:hypothetical protein
MSWHHECAKAWVLIIDPRVYEKTCVLPMMEPRTLERRDLTGSGAGRHRVVNA